MSVCISVSVCVCVYKRKRGNPKDDSYVIEDNNKEVNRGRIGG